jgi:2-alkenal reductase
MQVNNLGTQVSTLQSQVSYLRGFQNVTYQTINIQQNGTSLENLYNNVINSVVLIEGDTSTGGVQASGFVYTFADSNIVLTNNHVVQGTSNLSVTFSDGNGYSATVLGTDPYSDLAVVSVNGAPASEFKPLNIVSSSSLSVGEPVVAIGNPYGLVGSLTTGAVSALGRTITEPATAGAYAIANVIQSVVGITAAIVSNSQGLGFAIPSDTILREISALITTGSYSGHSYLGVEGGDMNYATAQQIHASVTYGFQITTVVGGGPSDGKLHVGDIVIGLGNQTIRNNDDLASYLEEHTLPGDSLTLTVVRGNSQVQVTVVLGTRPAPTT